MLKPTVRNLYQFMSVQAELHDPDTSRYYSYDERCRFLLVKSHHSIFKVNFLIDHTYELRITKNCWTEASTEIPKYGETKIYKRGIRITD